MQYVIHAVTKEHRRSFKLVAQNRMVANRAVPCLTLMMWLAPTKTAVSP
ncbi:hypothetical protein J3E64_002378 [Sphingobium sp. OAS761]|nr:hypothetical protein [Sphingobium sp. OAS761]